jgi:hypothetical protein
MAIASPSPLAVIILAASPFAFPANADGDVLRVVEN